ncbi:MAG: DEAD/DEAH box helicase [Agriterribacter sp.]
MRELRQYQVNGINAIAKKYADGKRMVIFQLATGGGKTVAFAGLVNRFLNAVHRRAVILVHKDELLKQARRTLYEWYDIVAAPVIAGNKYLPNSLVYTAMVETANNRLKNNPKYFGEIGLVIVDECHIGNFKKLYDYFPNALIVGFTATPLSGSKKDPLKNYFQDIVCGIDIPELIDMDSLVKNKTIDVFNVKRSDLKVKNGEFDELQMGNVFSTTKHVQNTVNAYRRHASGTKTIVFNCNIDHSKKVNAAFLAAGYNSRHLDGETDIRKREETLLWFKNTPNAVLNNVGVLTTGFDEPSIQTVIINRSTKSIPLWLQMTGRGSRPFEGKKQFLILDLGSNAETLGDWNVRRNWSDIFFNPESAEPKESPSKKCVGCDTIIHAGYKTCPHCGAINERKQEAFIEDFKMLLKQKPFALDIRSLIDEYARKRKIDGSPYKDTSVVHALKLEFVKQAQRVWRLKKINDVTAYDILDVFQKNIEEWCHHKQLEFGWWYKKQTKVWMFEALESSFGWENPLKIEQKQVV